MNRITRLPRSSAVSVAGRLLVLLLLLALVGSVSAQSASNVLRVGMEAPVELDPALGTNDPETAINRAIYDYLVEVAPDGTILNDLAQNYVISDDGLTYTFTLVAGATFHDGSAFSSADVVYTFNRLVEVGSPATRLLGDFQVSAPDASTVVFTLAAPNADFIYGVASRFALIVKDGATDVNLVAEGANPFVNFNGTGPFILAELTSERATFVANENYWIEGQPALDGLEFYFINDSVQQIDILLDGDLDLIYKVPIGQIDRLEGVEGISVLSIATSQHPVVRLRTDEGFAGADARVLQAFKYATDREFLNDLLLDGLGVVGNNDPIAPVYGDFYTPYDGIEYDPERACELLSDAGIGTYEGTLYAPNVFEYADLAAALAAMWQDGCINVDVQVLEAGLYYDDSNEINYLDVELGITGWGARPTPQLFFQEAYVTAALPENGGFNESRFSDPEVDALVAQAAVTPDTDARRAIYAELTRIFDERGPLIIPYFAPLIGAAHEGVGGLQVAPFPGLTDFRTVTLG